MNDLQIEETEEEASGAPEGQTRLSRRLSGALVPVRWLWHKLSGQPWLALSHILFWLTPLICFLMVEVLSENNPFTRLKPWQWLMNLVWYFCLLFIGWLITGRRKGAMVFDALFSFGIGVANHYILAFRGRALFPIDLLSLKTAANVAGSYDYTPDKFVWGGLAILAAVIGLQFLLPREQRGKQRWLKWFRLGMSLGWVIYIGVFFFTDMLPSLGVYAQQWKTQGNGFLLNFTVSARYMRAEKPEGYSKEEAQALIAELEEEGCTSDTVADGAGAVTNFIIIMDESFADLTQFESLTLSGDPTPFYHSLTENTIKGNMVSPVTGGGTASVEFEALTGSTMTFLPSGTVAYQLYLTGKTPSLAQIAGSMGVSSAAYHPYLSSGWNRTTAYENLGFDSQYYQDQVINGTAFGTDYAEDEIVREYVSDSADFERIYRITEENTAQGKSSFIFNVTMQNHSGYTKEWTNLSRGVTLTGEFVGNGYDQSTTQYLALMTETDRALEELITYYSNVEEDTVILFFGDHQPPLKNDLYKDIYGKALDDRTDAEVMEQYVTPFFIWANFDIPEQENVTIGSNFLGVLASQVAGYPQTGYMKFLSRLNETFAALTRVGCITQDGRVTSEVTDLTGEEQALVEQYSYLQYYNLFGDAEEDSFFYIGE